MLPELFAKRGSHGISGAAIVASGTGVAFLGLLGFEAIVEILNLLCELLVRLYGYYGRNTKILPATVLYPPLPS